MPKIVYYILSPIFILLGLGYLGVFLRLTSNILTHLPLFEMVFYGMVAYLFLYFLFLRRIDSRFWQTFDHEFTHIIFALIFFKKIANFTVSADNGGSVRHYGNSNFIIALAPYFVPTFALLLFVLRFIAHKNAIPYFNFSIGFLLMYDFVALIEEAHWDQPDLKRHGLLFSYSAIGMFYLAITGYILTFLGWGSGTAWIYIKSGITQFWGFAKML